MEAGYILNQYVFVEPLGEGGMAEVWKGRHSQLDYEVAIKFLKPQFAHDRDLQERFLNEGRRQANLDHPNIVRALDFISDRGRHFLVMKYVEGGGLDRRIQEANGPLPSEEVLNVSFQVLAALAYAHGQGVIHRDVKTSNVLMDREGNCYLTDFGIALAVGQQRLTRTGTVMGTDYYMSPEQIRSPHTVDHRTDIYAFGVVLFEMLTGVLPFESDNEFLLKQAHVEQAPPKPSKLNPAVSKAMESVVLRALAKNPDDRWGDCATMIEALEIAGTGARPPFRRTRPQGAPTPVAARPITHPVSRARRPPSQPVSGTSPGIGWFNRIRSALVLLVLGLALAVVVGALARSYFVRSRATVVVNSGSPIPPAPTVGPIPSGRVPPVNPGPATPAEEGKRPPDTDVRPPVVVHPAPTPGKREPLPPVVGQRGERPQPVTTHEPPRPVVVEPKLLPAARLPEPVAVAPNADATPKPNADATPKAVAGDTVKPTIRNPALALEPSGAGPREGPLRLPPTEIGPGRMERPPSPAPSVEAPPVPPVAPPRIPPVQASGTLIWSVQLKKNINESLIGMQPSSGQVRGDPLPGVPVAISISPPNAAGVVEAPSPANGWTTLRLRGLVNGNIVISIQWKRLVTRDY